MQRLESYANSVPTVVLIEIPDSHPESQKSPDHVEDKNDALPFLRALAADVQGARFQKHVLPFVLISHEDSADVGTALDGTTTTSCLHAGAIDVIGSPLRHEEINHLLGHVKDKIRSPAKLLASQMAQNLVDSIHNASEPRVTCHRPDLLLSAERKAAVEKAVSSWHFPAQQFNMDELTYGAMFMVEQVCQVPDLQAYGLSRPQLMSLLLETRRQYKHEREVHYHNWRHAVDVAQCIYCFLMDVHLAKSSAPDDRVREALEPIERILTPLDGLILLVSAIGHDVGHPGVNNAFLVACNHPLAQTYNDKSVLENYHCAAYSQLLRRHWPALNDIAGFRATMISTILATDMQRHFEYMKSMDTLKAKTESSEASVDDWSDKDREQARELIMAILIKAADISNVARPFDVSASWAKILMNEFARQGELESELQIPTCLFGGPPNKEDILAAAQSQKGFISLFGHPLFSGISELMPSLSRSVRELENNRRVWDRKIVEETERRKASENNLHATFSGVTQDEVDEATSHHNSEPGIPPPGAQNNPTSTKRATLAGGETSPNRRAFNDIKQQLAQGMAANDETKASAPWLTSSGVQVLSPSRRSSKDVALDHLQQLTSSSYQGPDLSPTPSSRRESGDAEYHISQSYPSSRRGSKDESLTTILVTSGGSPDRRASPSSMGKGGSPGKQGSKRQSLPYSQKQMNARTSMPSSRSHATSTATATTNQHSPSPPPSTQPSSAGLGDDARPGTHHTSIPSTEDPFIEPGNWPNEVDGSHRESGPDGIPEKLPASSPDPTSDSTAKDEPPQITPSVSTETADSRSTPRKPERGVRESRSRSRLRSLKFWKKRKDTSSSVEANDTPTASP